MVTEFPLRLLTECHLRNIRNIKLRDFFQHSNRTYDPDDFKHRFTLPSTWTPQLSRLSSTTRLAIERIDKGAFNLIAHRVFSKANELFINASSGEVDNLSCDEFRALYTLSRDRDIIIKPADKGGAVVIMNRDA
jgi:hypothetical protein